MTPHYSPPLPLYVHILISIGAFLGFSFLYSILFLLGFFDTAATLPLFILGALFIFLALGLDHLSRRARPLMQSFCMQSALLSMLSGKIIIILAVLTKFSDPWAMTIMLGLCSLSTYFVFQNIVDRFLFLLAFLLSLTSNLTSHFENNLPLFILFTLTILSILTLRIFKDRSVLYTPIEAALISYACLLTAFVSFNLFYADNITLMVPEIAFNFVLVGMVIIFILYHARLVKHTSKLPVLFSCVGLVILSLISNAGILWGIGLLILGYQDNKRTFISLGVLFLITFLIFYYYNLSLTLDYKSYLLMGNGLFLLLTRAVMHYLKWDR